MPVRKTENSGQDGRRAATFPLDQAVRLGPWHPTVRVPIRIPNAADVQDRRSIRRQY